MGYEVVLEKALTDLLVNELIQMTQDEDCFEPTQLSVAVVAAGLSPENDFWFTQNRDAPLSFQTMALAEISWMTFHDQLDVLGALDESGLGAIRPVGVNPASVNRLVTSGAELKENTVEETRLARIYRRAYSAFPLRDLYNEIPVHEISEKYSVPRSQVQIWAQTCHGFAGETIIFGEGWAGVCSLRCSNIC
ncbi:uncharacterized protein Z518_04496 [Rhinocladiella mackenziei CBS 650.93]|uniref:POLQ-like helical domain-containing protein n=1 Tax=Rhinocladiella mackenziei CBS 650.93 TaxID=1442369 RepID=A0A0D2JBQ8_9EURO|nr:uncharacterized protein Z518_04496 [Rhinocladiella mackenziei CBS 650.93]KIX06520.1 hypothetical protein Z518_04496 [Rhinocladiella mackenziei CBS 650.93]